MERVRKFISELSAHELLQLKADLDNKSKYLRHLVEAQIKDIETSNCKMCAHCGSEINNTHNGNLTLVFGPADFRKKATLCGMDCMESFMGKIKSIEQKSLIQNQY